MEGLINIRARFSKFEIFVSRNIEIIVENTWYSLPSNLGKRQWLVTVATENDTGRLDVF